MKKLLSLTLSIIMVIGLVACGNGAKTGNVPENPKVESVSQKKKLIMCTNAEFPPYEYKDGGEYAGIDVEVSKLIGEKLGVEVEILDIAFDSLIPTIVSGKADFAMAGMTVTEDRKEFVDFTHTYQTAVQSVALPANSSIAAIDDLNGKKIGVQLGTTGDIYCSGDYGDDAIERYPKIIDGFQAMKSGKIDAVVVDDQVAKNIVDQEPNAYKLLDTKYADEEYAIAVRKGNTELLDKLNNAIDEIKASGDLQRIIDKYIQ